MDDHEADGWAVLHDRSGLPPDARYADLYLFGPLPSKEVADLIESNSECPCKRRVVPLFFPDGVTMMLRATLPGTPEPSSEPIH
jgi:hypothetical protein